MTPPNRDVHVGEPFLILIEQPDTYIETTCSCILLVISPQAKASMESVQ